MMDLNSLVSPDLGYTLSSAEAINDNGWIVANATAVIGADRPFLLQPALPGDANLDGTVNIADLSLVLANFDKSGHHVEPGRFQRRWDRQHRGPQQVVGELRQDHRSAMPGRKAGTGAGRARSARHRRPDRLVGPTTTTVTATYGLAPDWFVCHTS